MFTRPSRFVDRIFVHCSASDRKSHDNIATMRRWHVQDNGWRDVGYHYFIRKNGKLEAGRPIGQTPAAQGGNNKGTIAICLHGLDELKFTADQFATLKDLAVEINNAYDGDVTFHGHKEVAAKACPVFDYKSVLKLDRFGRLGLTGSKKQKLVKDTHRDPATMPLLKRGMRGPSVALLQKQLLIKDDGIFGPRTETEVKEFQQARGLQRDGVVGKNTWKALFANERIEHFE